MIISHHHRFIFYAIPKTGSHAIRNALRPYLHQFDWEQCCLNERRSFPIPDLAKIRHGHITYQQVRPFLLEEMRDTYFSFAFVRNPLDRFLSYCYFKHNDGHCMTKDPVNTIKDIITSESEKNHVLLRPQHTFISNEKGECEIDFFGRYEDLYQDYLSVCNRIGLPSAQLNIVNNSIRPVNITLDAEVINWVQDFYLDDYHKFNYELKL